MKSIWLKNPLAILGSGAGGGLVIEGGRIAELVATGNGHKGNLMKFLMLRVMWFCRASSIRTIIFTKR